MNSQFGVIQIVVEGKTRIHPLSLTLLFFLLNLIMQKLNYHNDDAFMTHHLCSNLQDVMDIISMQELFLFFVI